MQAANLEETSRGCHIYQGGLCIIISFTECRSVICVFGNNAGPAPAVCNGFGVTEGVNWEKWETPPSPGSGRSSVPIGIYPSAPRRPLRAPPRLFKRWDRHLFALGRGSGGSAERDHPEVSGERAPCAISAEITAHCWLPGNILDQHRCGSRGEFSRPGCPAAPVGTNTRNATVRGKEKKRV